MTSTSACERAALDGRPGSCPEAGSCTWKARRRFFLKSYGPFYTALADAAFIAGFAGWRLRRRLQGKADVDPPHMLADSIRHSVFVAGFTPTEVENPAMKPDRAP